MPAATIVSDGVYVTPLTSSRRNHTLTWRQTPACASKQRFGLILVPVANDRVIALTNSFRLEQLMWRYPSGCYAAPVHACCPATEYAGHMPTSPRTCTDNALDTGNTAGNPRSRKYESDSL